MSALYSLAHFKYVLHTMVYTAISYKDLILCIEIYNKTTLIEVEISSARHPHTFLAVQLGHTFARI